MTTPRNILRPHVSGIPPAGFTLMEIMMVVVLLGVLAGLALPRLNQTLAKGNEETAMSQLRTIHAANKVYFSRTRSYWPPNGSSYDLTAINSNLGVSLIGNQMTYACTGTNGSTFTCTATPTSGTAYTVRITQADLAGNNVNPCSTRKGATCP